MVITVDSEDIVRMIERAANEVGLGLRSFYELGKADELDEPSLRDMWLIWGNALTEDDLPDAAMSDAEREMNQARATVREYTEAAVAQLRSMGYEVDPPPS